MVPERHLQSVLRGDWGIGQAHRRDADPKTIGGTKMRRHLGNLLVGGSCISPWRLPGRSKQRLLPRRNRHLWQPVTGSGRRKPAKGPNRGRPPGRSSPETQTMGDRKGPSRGAGLRPKRPNCRGRHILRRSLFNGRTFSGYKQRPLNSITLHILIPRGFSGGGTWGAAKRLGPFFCTAPPGAGNWRRWWGGGDRREISSSSTWCVFLLDWKGIAGAMSGPPVIGSFSPHSWCPLLSRGVLLGIWACTGSRQPV